MSEYIEIVKSIRAKALDGSFVLSKDEAAAMMEFHCKIAVLQRENELDRACLDTSSDGGVESRHASRSITPLTRGAEKSFGLETLDAKGTAGVAPCPSEAIPLPGSFPFTKAVQG